MLIAIFLIPLLTAVGILFIPRHFRFVIRAVALLATALTAVLAVVLFLKFDLNFKPAAA